MISLMEEKQATALGMTTSGSAAMKQNAGLTHLIAPRLTNSHMYAAIQLVVKI